MTDQSHLARHVDAQLTRLVEGTDGDHVIAAEHRVRAGRAASSARRSRSAPASRVCSPRTTSSRGTAHRTGARANAAAPGGVAARRVARAGDHGDAAPLPTGDVFQRPACRGARLGRHVIDPPEGHVGADDDRDPGGRHRLQLPGRKPERRDHDTGEALLHGLRQQRALLVPPAHVLQTTTCMPRPRSSSCSAAASCAKNGFAMFGTISATRLDRPVRSVRAAVFTANPARRWPPRPPPGSRAPTGASRISHRRPWRWTPRQHARHPPW